MTTINETLSRYFPPAPATYSWQGVSDKWYLHNVYPINAVPEWIKICNYIFTATDKSGRKRPLYIGQNGKFDKSLSQHEKLSLATEQGATEAHIHLLCASMQERKQCEIDLRLAHPTPLNDQTIAVFAAPPMKEAEAV